MGGKGLLTPKSISAHITRNSKAMNSRIDRYIKNKKIKIILKYLNFTNWLASRGKPLLCVKHTKPCEHCWAVALWGKIRKYFLTTKVYQRKFGKTTSSNILLYSVITRLKNCRIPVSHPLKTKPLCDPNCDPKTGLLRSLGSSF
jgi:hypothetical protein